MDLKRSDRLDNAVVDKIQAFLLKTMFCDSPRDVRLG